MTLSCTQITVNNEPGISHCHNYIITRNMYVAIYLVYICVCVCVCVCACIHNDINEC